MLASGALSPLDGFMGREDYERVVEEMRLASGLPWALPVCLAVAEAPRGDRVALADEAGRLLAVLDVEEVYEYDKEREAERCFRTTDDAHPGVARLYGQSRLYLAGQVTVFERPDAAVSRSSRRDPAETRAVFAERGWKRVVGFQTRNPIHRAHEYLTKVRARDRRRAADPPARRRDEVGRRPRRRARRVLPRPRSTATTRRPRARSRRSRPRCATPGPREAIWHAICRKNYGCSHFIVGRDHAGVGDYYGTYDAQLIFDEFEPHELDIEPMFFEHSFCCNACGSMASAKTCPHGGDDHVFLSGTKVRELLARRASCRRSSSRGRRSPRCSSTAYRAQRGGRRRVEWQLTLAGLLIGLLVGLTGMGGGSLMTPILVIVFGFKPTAAIGTDILHGAIFKSFGAVRHRRLGTVHARLTGWMLLGSRADVARSASGSHLAQAPLRDGEASRSRATSSGGASSRRPRLRSPRRSSSAAFSRRTRRSCSAAATRSSPSRSALSAASSSGSPRSGAASSSGW